MRWKWFGVGRLQNKIEILVESCRWGHANDIPAVSFFSLSCLLLLLLLRAAPVRWTSPDGHAAVCLPNYRGQTSIRKCQSAVLIQIYFKAWSIIYSADTSWSKINHSWQIGEDITAWKHIYGYYFHAVPMHGHLLPFLNPHCPDTHHKYLLLSIKFNKQ